MIILLNIIWPIFIIAAFIYAIFFGNIINLNNAIFNSAKETVSLCTTFLGTMCLWNGIMQIARNTTLIKRITKGLEPLINFLFPEIKENKEIKEEVSINMASNILGLGNAATPLGLKAIESMQKVNKEKNRLSNSMAMFILINTASIQVIPTTVIAIRSSLGSIHPSKIIVGVWISTIAAFLTAIISGKILMKKI